MEFITVTKCNDVIVIDKKSNDKLLKNVTVTILQVANYFATLYSFCFHIKIPNLTIQNLTFTL